MMCVLCIKLLITTFERLFSFIDEALYSCNVKTSHAVVYIWPLKHNIFLSQRLSKNEFPPPNKSEDSLQARVLPHIMTLTVMDGSKAEVKTQGQPHQQLVERLFRGYLCQACMEVRFVMRNFLKTMTCYIIISRTFLTVFPPRWLP